MLYEHAVAKGAAQQKDIEDHDAARSKIKREEAKALWMMTLWMINFRPRKKIFADVTAKKVAMEVAEPGIV